MVEGETLVQGEQKRSKKYARRDQVLIASQENETQIKSTNREF